MRRCWKWCGWWWKDFILICLICFIFVLYLFYNKKCFEKESDGGKIKSAGDFVKVLEEGKKFESENDNKREKKLNRVWIRFVWVFDVEVIDEFLVVVEFIG